MITWNSSLFPIDQFIPLACRYTVWQLSITWILLAPLQAKYVCIPLCKAEQNVWPCCKRKHPNLAMVNLRFWHCLSIADSKYVLVSFIRLVTVLHQMVEEKQSHYGWTPSFATQVLQYIHSSDHHSFRLCW